MSVMIQIRNVPDALHRTLKARAAKAGKSLSDYLLDEVRRVAERPTLEEMLERLHRLPEVELSPSPAEIIREVRDRS
jgi:plasmid stability protein